MREEPRRASHGAVTLGNPVAWDSLSRRACRGNVRPHRLAAWSRRLKLWVTRRRSPFLVFLRLLVRCAEFKISPDFVIFRKVLLSTAAGEHSPARALCTGQGAHGHGRPRLRRVHTHMRHPGGE